jgi:hypothetical protein
LTTNEPVATPPEIEHEGELANVLPPEEVIVQLPSPVLNPEPETVIVWPPMPLLGKGVMAGLVTVNPAETVVCTTNAFDIVTAYGPTPAVAATTKSPVRVPSVAMLQLVTAAPVNRPPGDEVVVPMQAVGAPAL